MGSLTAMLVLATLTSVYTEELPNTSYFKVKIVIVGDTYLAVIVKGKLKSKLFESRITRHA